MPDASVTHDNAGWRTRGFPNHQETQSSHTFGTETNDIDSLGVFYERGQVGHLPLFSGCLDFPELCRGSKVRQSLGYWELGRTGGKRGWHTRTLLSLRAEQLVKLPRSRRRQEQLTFQLWPAFPCCEGQSGPSRSEHGHHARR
jgi:hypothetical protein